ncbi:MAG: type II toxin-antitoxin system PemK/MazF family toxin [archaeon]|jgi:mRNA interferase MazF
MTIKRGDILLINLDPVKGSEQGKIRPCVVIQNDISNEYSPTTIVAAITSALSDKKYPTEVKIAPKESCLLKESTILLNQIRTISLKDRAIKKIGKLTNSKMNEVNEAIKISLAL